MVWRLVATDNTRDAQYNPPEHNPWEAKFSMIYRHVTGYVRVHRINTCDVAL